MHSESSAIAYRGNTGLAGYVNGMQPAAGSYSSVYLFAIITKSPPVLSERALYCATPLLNRRTAKFYFIIP